MFCALPAETVFEAKERTRRATFYLFILLAGIYVLFANLLALCAYFFILMIHGMPGAAGFVANHAYDMGLVMANACFGAALFAVLHFWLVRNKSLNDMLAQIRARDADEKDQYHRQFIHIVQEAEAATGIQGIRPVVLSDPGCNAFSLQDGQGRAAIGATEGLLSKLNRGELCAVVAHEAAHLVHEDSRLVTTACFLFAVFGQINQALGAAMQGSLYSTYDRRSSPRASGFSGIFLALWLISGLGYLVTRLISMAISREREYLADADGVAMCKDPLALAESLYKISRRYRGNVPEGFSALFILNPGDYARDEQEGPVADLFSNHPPVSERLSKLLVWAKSDLPSLEALDAKEEAEGAAVSSPASAEGAGFMAYRDNQWIGPYNPQQFLALGFMTPSTWVCPAGSQQVARASEIPDLLPIFGQGIQGLVSLKACPRCKVPLMTARYEGAEVEQCGFCKGYLLGPGVLERLITRGEVIFSPEEIKKAKIWRDSQRGPLKDRDHFPEIKCPACGSPMGKGIHSMLTQVVIDHCFNDHCGAIWCDGGELETIQMIIQDAHILPVQGA